MRTKRPQPCPGGTGPTQKPPDPPPPRPPRAPRPEPAGIDAEMAEAGARMNPPRTFYIEGGPEATIEGALDPGETLALGSLTLTLHEDRLVVLLPALGTVEVLRHVEPPQRVRFRARGTGGIYPEVRAATPRPAEDAQGGTRVSHAAARVLTRLVQATGTALPLSDFCEQVAAADDLPLVRTGQGDYVRDYHG